MKLSEYLDIIDRIDQKLSDKEIPIYQRPQQAKLELSKIYNNLYFSISNDLNDLRYQNLSPSEVVEAFYNSKFGDNLKVSFDIGKLAIMIKNELFFVRIPLVFGEVEIDLFSLIEKITPAFIAKLNSTEIYKVILRIKDGYELLYEIRRLEDCLHYRSISNKIESSLLDSALADYHAAIGNIYDVKKINTNLSCFHSQQNAEKILKGYLLSKQIVNESELKKYFKHNVMKLFRKCAEISNGFECLDNHVTHIARLDMNIRYTGERILVKDTISYLWSALNISGFVSCKITGMGRRFEGWSDK